MLGRIPPETVREIIIVVATFAVNAILSNFIWWLLGSLRSRVRTLARVGAAFVAILNLGLGMVCLLTMLREGPTWFYIVMMLIAVVFAFRVGGATRGKYT